jgi:hypothetical protein
MGTQPQATIEAGVPTLPVQPTGPGTAATEAPAAAPTVGTPLPQATTTAVPELESLSGLHLIDLNSAQEISLFEGSDATWVRYDQFHWDMIEPERTEPPAYQWSAVNESGLLNAVQSGMKPIGMILFTPAWAQKHAGMACGPVAEQALGAFAQFAGALVSRYSQPPYNVKVWELGNEPDILLGAVDPHSGYGCWGEPNEIYFGGEYYAEMLKVVYPAIKAADPGATVLVGGLLMDCDPVNSPETSPGSGVLKDCIASRFLEGILADGGGDFFDGVSFHAYDYYGEKLGIYGNGNWGSAYSTTGPVLVAKSQFIRSLLENYGHPDKMLLNTEVALLCSPEGSAKCTSEEFIKTKAAFLAQANVYALREGLAANIWYHLRGWRGSELVDAALQPNLAYQALAFNSKVLLGATFSSEITLFPGVRGFELNRNGKRLWMLWSLDETAHQIQLPAQPVTVYDLFGSPLQANTNLTVDSMPVYVEFGQ